MSSRGIRRPRGWRSRAAHGFFSLSKTVRHRTIAAYCAGRLSRRMAYLGLSAGEILTRWAVQLLILDQDGESATPSRWRIPRMMNTERSTRSGVGNVLAISRTLIKLAALGALSTTQLVGESFLHAFSGLLIASAILDVIIAAYRAQSITSPIFNHWDEAAFFIVCAECVGFVA